ncbi:DNA cytosine methyltransferase [Sphingomonas quercus]|uniref:DNA cytosine methyltransferase n=1 Tax=Sphingomonas quercus TaxID=2842451 RepID=A0ABS6BNN1_9SPHN|nr:DNA cytosine methyltransferase [Sphingomonas quercus]MBU3078864.1 DNA cytosine methyltransferase [Sphingomonas quercus]
MLLSLFCGAGGLDVGFEAREYEVGLAFDLRKDSIASYNHNRKSRPSHGHVGDVSKLTLEKLDELHGSEFAPEGVIGGPPCQSFSRANTVYLDADPRHSLPLAYAKLLGTLNERNPVKFFVMENVTGLLSERHAHRLRRYESAFQEAGFTLNRAVLLATDYSTSQIRERLFLVGFNSDLYGDAKWTPPPKIPTADGRRPDVRQAIGHLPDATYYKRGLTSDRIPHHVNHWCMKPKSAKFTTPGALKPGDGSNRSFKTLAWDKPSPTVAYGHREVHIHPSCTRRLSVYEAMLLQGFPPRYELIGSLSSQIVQISEAVPPPVASAVALSIRTQIAALDCAREPAAGMSATEARARA